MALAALPATHLATRPAPPALTAPASYEVSFGRVAGTAPSGSRWIIVRIGRRALTARRLRGGSFDFAVELPVRETTVRVTAVREDGKTSTARVEHVFGLPLAARLRRVRGFAQGTLTGPIVRLARGFPGTSAV